MGFIGRSLLVLSVLYGLLFLVVDLFLLHNGVPLWGGVVFILVLFAIQYLVSPWLIEWFFSIDWDPEALPAVHRAFVENSAASAAFRPSSSASSGATPPTPLPSAASAGTLA